MPATHTACGTLVLDYILHPHPRKNPCFGSILASLVSGFNHNLLLQIPPRISLKIGHFLHIFILLSLNLLLILSNSFACPLIMSKIYIFIYFKKNKRGIEYYFKTRRLPIKKIIIRVSPKNISLIFNPLTFFSVLFQDKLFFIMCQHFLYFLF